MDRLNDILKIPDRCLLKKKLTKAFFKRNFELTTGERNLLDDFSIVVNIDWIATVGPASANIARYEAGQYLYEEVQVISVQSNREGFEKNAPRVADVIQKYIPYPILLCIYNEDVFILNTCDKRINQNDNTRRTIEQRYYTKPISIVSTDLKQADFLNSLNYTGLDKTNLKTYFDSYSQCIVALQTMDYSGVYAPRSKERTDADMQTLQTIQTMQNEITILQNLAKKETQMNQKVALNIQVQDKRKEIEHLKTSLIN